MHRTPWMLALTLLAVLPTLPGCAEDEDKSAPVERPLETMDARERAAEEEVGKPPSLEALWKALVPPPEPREGPYTTTVVIPLGPGTSAVGSDAFAGIRLPEAPSKTQVRVYVGTILRAASKREMFGTDDPEVKALARVGPEHVDVLIEPLAYLSHFDGDIYVVEALKTLVRENHKSLVLKHLPAARELVELVVARGWTKDAAPTLFKVLAARDPYLSTDWVEAAASVGRPEQYEDLKFHLRNGSNSYPVWQALRNLPGIEPLEPTIVSAWRDTSRERDAYEWGQLAMAAAHYGHMAGLEFIVEEMEQYVPAWEAFQRLTGYGPDIEVLWPEDLKKARAWFAANKERMEFDRANMRYVVRKPKKSK